MSTGRICVAAQSEEHRPRSRRDRRGRQGRRQAPPASAAGHDAPPFLRLRAEASRACAPASAPPGKTDDDTTRPPGPGDVAAGVIGRGNDHGHARTGKASQCFRDIYRLGPLVTLAPPTALSSRAAYWAGLFPDTPPARAEFEEEEARYAQWRLPGRGSQVAARTVRRACGCSGCARCCPRRGGPALSMLSILRQRFAGGVTPSQPEVGELGGLSAPTRLIGEMDRHIEWANGSTNRAVPSGVRRWSQPHHPPRRRHYDALLLASATTSGKRPAGRSARPSGSATSSSATCFSRGDFCCLANSVVACCCAAPTDRSPRP